MMKNYNIWYIYLDLSRYRVFINEQGDILYENDNERFLVRALDLKLESLFRRYRMVITTYEQSNL